MSCLYSYHYSQKVFKGKQRTYYICVFIKVAPQTNKTWNVNKHRFSYKVIDKID